MESAQVQPEIEKLAMTIDEDRESTAVSIALLAGTANGFFWSTLGLATEFLDIPHWNIVLSNLAFTVFFTAWLMWYLRKGEEMKYEEI